MSARTIIAAESHRHADFWRLQQRLAPTDVVIITDAGGLRQLHALQPGDIARAVLVTEPRAHVMAALEARLRVLGVTLETPR